MKVKIRTTRVANEHARFCAAWRWIVEVVGEVEAARMKNSVVPCPALLPYNIVSLYTPVPKGVG